MKRAINIFSIGSFELLFIYDQAQQPAIEVKGMLYSSLKHLLELIPQLEEPRHYTKLAQIVNFLAKGLEFQYIENIDLFKKNYEQQIAEKQSHLLSHHSKLKEYGVFDLTVMHPPCLMNQKLVFFVKHDYLSIPYKVTLFYPLHRETLHLSYELLPVLS